MFCSTDNQHSLKAWNNTSELEGGLGGVHVPLISDNSHKISRDFGVLDEEEGVPQRALFIIDPRGRVRNITVNDTDVGRSVDETQRILDALIFKDEFGEGCPIDWKKGDTGIDVKTKTNVEGPIEIAKRTTWSGWARPKLARAWSGASTYSTHSINAAPRPAGIDSTLSNSNYNSATGSIDHSPLVSPSVKATEMSHFEGQMEEAIHAQRNVEAAMENMRAALQNQSIGVAT